MWWDSQRFVKKCDIDVTAAWQQVPTASEHYWSIVCFSWRGSFCRQPRIIVTRGERPWHWHRPEREKDCCRVFENLDQEIVDDDKGFFYWEVTPNMKDDAGDQLIMDWPPLIFSRCFNKCLVYEGGDISLCHLLLHNSDTGHSLFLVTHVTPPPWPPLSLVLSLSREKLPDVKILGPILSIIQHCGHFRRLLHSLSSTGTIFVRLSLTKRVVHDDILLVECLSRPQEARFNHHLQRTTRLCLY